MKIWIYISIFILTIADGLFTTLGVKSGFVEEANPLFERVMHASPELSAIAVVVGVGLLLLLMYKVQHKIKWISYALMAVFAVKVYVLALHLSWITQLAKI